MTDMAEKLESIENTSGLDDTALADLIGELQSLGMRVEADMEVRSCGAGPADAGMLWIEGMPTTVPAKAAYAAQSPYALRNEDDGFAIYRGDQRLASADPAPRPNYYSLSTAEGIEYWKIAVMHLTSVASTVLQTCTYWGKSDQCKFCGIGVSYESGRTIAKKTPEMLAEVALAARDLDGARDVTLTTGSTATPDRGALYIGKCAQAVKEATGLPIEVQFEPPADLSVIDRVHDMGADSVGIHMETFDPKVLEAIAPGKYRWGMDTYWKTWEHAVKVFGWGQVSTYVILGMGEDPKVTVEGCKRAIDMGVYPFVVPLRPTVGSLMADAQPPSREYVREIYDQVVPYLAQKGMRSTDVKAGCVACQACSGMPSLERVAAAGPIPLNLSMPRR